MTVFSVFRLCQFFLFSIIQPWLICAIIKHIFVQSNFHVLLPLQKKLAPRILNWVNVSFTRSITWEVSRTGPIRDFNVFAGNYGLDTSSLSFLRFTFLSFFFFTPLEKKRLSKKMTPEFHIKFLVIWSCVIHCCVRGGFRMTEAEIC